MLWEIKHIKRGSNATITSWFQEVTPLPLVGNYYHTESKRFIPGTVLAVDGMCFRLFYLSDNCELS